MEALCVRNMRIQSRPLRKVLAKIIFPAMLILIQVCFRAFSSVEMKKEATIFEEYSLENFVGINRTCILYSPNSTVINQIMKEVGKSVKADVKGFINETEMETFYLKKNVTTIGAIVFPKNIARGFEKNVSIELKIRPLNYRGESWNIDKAISTFPLVDINYKSNHGTLYWSSGFLVLQNAVSKVIMKNFVGNKYPELDIKMSRLPEAPYKIYKYLRFSTYAYLTMLNACFIMPIFELNAQLVADRKNKYKEILKTQGVGKKIYYMALKLTTLAWFLIINGLLVTGLCINFYAGAVIEFTHPAIIYIWTLAFSLNIISYTFFISSLFNKVSVLFFVQTRGVIEQITMTKYLVWLLPNTLFAISIQIILRNEIIGTTFTWKNFINNFLDMETNLFTIIIIYIISTTIFLICGLYIEELKDKKPWYFPFMKKYWCSTKNMPAPETTPEDTPACAVYNFEVQDETDQSEIIHIKNLKYKQELSAQLIEIPDLKLYKGTIVSIFGYKGSGKSNFLSLLCGEKKATAGKILIKGYTNQEFPIEKIGIYNNKQILCKEMTVKENLHLYSLLKRINNRVEEVQRITELWHLKNEINLICANLPESVARKISLAITFIGDPEAIFLNSPTKYTDEVTRNFILQAIEKKKETSLTIFTSQDIEECFAISDKVIILHNHEVKAIGSPMFLKTTYGVYSICEFKSTNPFEMSQMKTYIKSQMNSTATIHEDEFRITLKYEPNATFERLFEFSKDLKFIDSTISEIPVHDLVEKILERDSESNEDLNDLGAEFTSVHKMKISGLQFFVIQMKGIAYKKFISSKNNVILTFSKLTMLAILVCLSHLSRNNPIDSNCILEDNRIFDLKAFGETKIIYSSSKNDLGKMYASLLREEETQKLKINNRMDFVDYCIRKSKEDKISYKTKYIIAAVFEDSKRITAYYNAAAYHSSVASLNYIYNSLISHELKEEQMKLHISNVPLPSKDADSIYVGPHSNFYESFYWAGELVISTATILTYYSTDFAEERKSKFKYLQYINGLNAFTYYLGSFAYDYLTYAISVFFSLEIITLFETPCLHKEAEIAGLGILMYLHGITALLLIYCLSHIFKEVYIYNGIFLYYALGIFLVFSVTELEMHSYQDTAYYANIIFTVLLTPYSMGRGIYQIHRNCVAKSVCTSSDHSNLYRNEYYFCTGSFNGFHTGAQAIFLQLLVLTLQSFVLILFLILLEVNIHKIIWKWISCKNKKIDILDDAENREISSNVTLLSSFLYTAQPEYVNEECLLNIEIYEHKLRKKTTLRIKEKECMTLIFHFSSEKEQFMNLIAGLENTTQAKIIINGNNIWEYPNKVIDHLGFNLTIDCLQQDFTIGETLSIFSLIKGIKKTKRKKFIKELVQVLNLQPEFKVKDCNHSIKKKLTAAIAVMGLPPVVVLNQPSQNMDEISIRQTKKLIMMAKKAGSAVLLVSERFDGCEASCDKVAIIKEKQVVFYRPLNTANETGDSLIVVKLWLNKFRDIPAGGQVKVTKEDVLAYCQKEFPPYLILVQFEENDLANDLVNIKLRIITFDTFGVIVRTNTNMWILRKINLNINVSLETD